MYIIYYKMVFVNTSEQMGQNILTLLFLFLFYDIIQNNKEVIKMKCLIAYASITGNTEKVANAIYDAIPVEKKIKKISNEPIDVNDYDVILVGYWVDRGSCSAQVAAFLSHLHNKKVAIFGTMGSSTDGTYGEDVSQTVQNLIPKDNTILGDFICQGKLQPALKKQYEESLRQDPNDIHVITQLNNYEAGLTHPDRVDLKQAAIFGRNIIQEV